MKLPLTLEINTKITHNLLLEALGQLILKKWLFPHRILSPCFTLVFVSMVFPFTHVLKKV